MTLPGGGLRLQTSGGLAAQLFDSTLRMPSLHYIITNHFPLGLMTFGEELEMNIFEFKISFSVHDPAWLSLRLVFRWYLYYNLRFIKNH